MIGKVIQLYPLRKIQKNKSQVEDDMQGRPPETLFIKAGIRVKRSSACKACAAGVRIFFG